MEDYEKLLQSAYEKMPRKAEGKKRFEVPQVSSEIQGARTMIKNFSEIASILRRDENHLAKFFSKELAAPVSMQNGSLVIQTKVSRDVLNRKLADYVKYFVFCKVCGQPDTKLEKENRIMFMRCDACGARSAAKSI